MQTINYVTTLWDLCHRDTPEFPEVREFNTYLLREWRYKSVLGQSVLVITDSFRLAEAASTRYGIDIERFLPMPFAPSPLLEASLSSQKEAVLQKYQLTQEYFYYPAQFWPHKNHIRIIQALLILRESFGTSPLVVFSGKDYGNLEWIKRHISKNKLETQVRFLGFVPSEDMLGLYQGATAVVMPTYFGPTNLPPLEAWAAGTPLIYSLHLSEQVGNAALLVDVDDAESIAHGMMQAYRQTVRETLVTAGTARLKELLTERENAERQLVQLLRKFENRRGLWRLESPDI
jgi:glycosyltransferase involved in cell wall biosynthesis